MSSTSVLIPEEEMARQRNLALEVKALPHRPRSYHVVTYGCQMNAHDSEKIAGMLEEMGLSHAPRREEADFVIFNTCCIRENAERKALGNVAWLKEIKRQRPEMMIAVCGCMAQEPGMAERLMKQYRFVDLVFGTSNLYRLPELLLSRLCRTEGRAFCAPAQKACPSCATSPFSPANPTSQPPLIAVDDADTIPEGVPVRRLRHDAAYLTIMYGCNNFCSYCIVPYVRGRERSRRAEDILREAEGLAASGVREIMLLGQNVNSYGLDSAGKPLFPSLLRSLDRIGIERIRFMTSHPKDLSDDLIAAMAESAHVLPQFHLPVQSGSDPILSRMNRHYTRSQYLDRVRKLRAAIPGIGLSTDIIVAFPGETEADFEDTLSLVREVRYDSAFTFVYSPRTGTKAASFPDQIDPEIAKDRITRLIALQDALQQETLSRFLNQEEEILVESVSRRSDEAVSGKGRHGVSVTVPGSAEDIGKIIRCRITSVKNNTLIGER